MEIKYTYREPEERPIERAELKSKYGQTIVLRIATNGKDIAFDRHEGFLLNPNDFADFCTLVNRINRQINGGA